MRTSRVCAAIVASFVMFATGAADADVASPTTGGETAVLNPYLDVWIKGDGLGPADKIGKKTGAGTMDAAFTWDKVAFASDPSAVTLATLFTRSASTKNNNDSYMQGGLALAKLTASGVQKGDLI